MLQVTIQYEFVIEDTGLVPGTNDKAGQDAFIQAKSKAESTRNEIKNGVKQIDWRAFDAKSGLELKGNDPENFNVGPVDAYCSTEGAVVKRCEDWDLNCWDPPCSCSKDEGPMTKCSEYLDLTDNLDTFNQPCSISPGTSPTMTL